ncbi:MAG TPA: hypothetical protein DHU78_00250 [Opitutae bacterium]|nr:hypothetical protein [Puniceicoccaceae bacterium]HAU60285.1 hypothetical protein [Opitutae bacterium]HCY57271.1 hypothetical protein [Opitutae bacterium]
MKPSSPQGSEFPNQHKRPFLGIHYVKCGTYGRIYRNKERNAYVGHCPRCMHPVRVKIGAEGTGNRFFKCFCP